MRKSARIRTAILITAGSAFAVRAVYLFRRPLWFDEIFTLWIARRPAAAILEAIRLDPGPPLFYFLERPFVAAAEAFGADALVRAISFAALAVLFLAGARPQTSGGARFPVLLAASPLLFFYCAEARAYALLGALGFLLFLSDFRFRSRRARLAGAALAAGILPWTHYLGVFVVAGSILLCLDRRRRSLALVQVAAIAPFAAWVPTALRQPAASTSWSEEGVWRSVEHALGVFGGWSRVPAYFSGFDPPASWAGAILGVLLIGAAVVAARRDRAVRAALLFAGIPLLLAAAAGFFRPVYFSGRTEMATLPVALWAFARAARRSPAARLLTTTAAGAGAVVIAAALLAPPSTPPYAVTARFLSSAARPGELVVASDADYLPLRLASDRGRLAAALVGVSSEIEEHPGWFEPGRLSSPEAESRRVSGAIESIPPGKRVFLAIPPDPAPRAVVSPFLRGKGLRVVRPPGGDAVLVLVGAAGADVSAVPDARRSR